MSANAPKFDSRYPVMRDNEFSDWVKQRPSYFVNSSNGMTELDSPLPPMSKLILITSDDGVDSLFFASGMD